MLMKYIYYHTHTHVQMQKNYTFEEVKEEIEKAEQKKGKLLERRKEIDDKIDTWKKEIRKLETLFVELRTLGSEKL